MKSMFSVSRFVLGAMLVMGMPAAQALAQQPSEAEVRATAAPLAPPAPAQDWAMEQSAEARATDWQKKAGEYKAMGVAAYRAGLVQNAEAQVAKYSAEAQRLRARASVDPATLQWADAQAAHFQRLAAEYRNMGGAAYRAGLVQRAEAEARKYELVGYPAPATPARLYHETPPFKPWLN